MAKKKQTVIEHPEDLPLGGLFAEIEAEESHPAPTQTDQRVVILAEEVTSTEHTETTEESQTVEIAEATEAAEVITPQSVSSAHHEVVSDVTNEDSTGEPPVTATAFPAAEEGNPFDELIDEFTIDDSVPPLDDDIPVDIPEGWPAEIDAMSAEDVDLMVGIDLEVENTQEVKKASPTAAASEENTPIGKKVTVAQTPVGKTVFSSVAPAETPLEADAVIEKALTLPATNPDNFPWRSTLGRMLAGLVKVKRLYPLNTQDKDTLDALALGIKNAEGEGSVSVRLHELIDLLPGSTVEEWQERLEDLTKASLVMTAEDYRLRRHQHAGLGRSVEPYEGPAPFIWDENPQDLPASRLYLTRLFDDEVRLAQSLSHHAKSVYALSPEEETLVTDVTNAAGCDAGQQAAIMTALHHGLAIISGGPGTGKTRTVGVLLSLLATLFPKRGAPLTFYLAAPTGKATGRLRESLDALLSDEKLQSQLAMLRDTDRVRIMERTLHKWLVTNTASGARPSATSPLECDVLVIDEASMMDAHLATRLMRAVAPETRVIILGDKHQLEAVGPGSVFADISEKDGALKNVVSLLTTSHRFKAGGVVDKVAKLINHEDPRATPAQNTEALLQLLDKSEGETDEMGYAAYWHSTPQTLREMGDEEAQRNFRFWGISPDEKAWLDRYFEEYWAALLPLLRAKTAEAYKAAYGPFVEAVGHTRALAAQRDGAHSVTALNDYFTMRMAKALAAEGLFTVDRGTDTEEGSVEENRQADDFLSGEDMRYREFLGRLLIVRQNNDRLGVYNGDVAVILPALDENGVPTDQWIADFMDGSRRLRPVMLPRHETAFAMTIHQSQGSDFKEVGVFLPNPGVKGLASRELLYTGVTRTKGVVHLFGTKSVLGQAMSTSLERTSGLVDRLRDILIDQKDFP